MVLLTAHRFTTKEFYQMAETGLLRPDARVELLDGQIIDMAPIGPSHGGTTNHLNLLLSAPARGRWIVSIQNPVHLDAHSAPQTDLMLLRPAADFYRARHPQPQDVLLLIETADTSLTYDRDQKLPAYGRAGIAEVWILNLNEGALEVCREPHLAGYSSRTLLRPGDTARPLAFPDVAVDVREILAQAKV